MILLHRHAGRWLGLQESPSGRNDGMWGDRRMAGKTYKVIAEELDLPEYHMENCAAIVRLMEAAGLTELYRRLTEKLDHVPQCT